MLDPRMYDRIPASLDARALLGELSKEKPEGGFEVRTTGETAMSSTGSTWSATMSVDRFLRWELRLGVAGPADDGSESKWLALKLDIKSEMISGLAEFVPALGRGEGMLFFWRELLDLW